MCLLTQKHFVGRRITVYDGLPICAQYQQYKPASERAGTAGVTSEVQKHVTCAEKPKLHRLVKY